MPNDSGPQKKPVPQANGGAKKPAPKADGAKKPAGKPAPAKKPTPAVKRRGSPDEPRGHRKFGQVMIDLGFITEDQLWDILEEAQSTGVLTGQVALERGLVTE